MMMIDDDDVDDVDDVVVGSFQSVLSPLLKITSVSG